MDISEDNQYKRDIFYKLNFIFKKDNKILDLGCGDGIDANIFTNKYKLITYGVDIYKHENIRKEKLKQFKIGSIYNIPYKDNYFDYVFLHDVLHHIDEKEQRSNKHKQGLQELKRVCKKGGEIIIIEGNRYNPLFYPHMVKKLGHEHWRQGYFIHTILDIFPNAQFKFFESHFYPSKYLRIFKIYEYIMEHFMPRMFIGYNVAIIKI